MPVESAPEASGSSMLYRPALQDTAISVLHATYSVRCSQTRQGKFTRLLLARALDRLRDLAGPDSRPSPPFRASGPPGDVASELRVATQADRPEARAEPYEMPSNGFVAARLNRYSNPKARIL